MFVPEVKNLYTASKIPKEAKANAIADTQNALVRSTDEYAGQGRRGFLDTDEVEKMQTKYAGVLAKGMVNGDEFNGVEEYFPKGMSTGFINALAKSGYAPGPNDPDTQNALAKLIDARVAEELTTGGRSQFTGDWGVRAVKDPDGFRLEAYTEEYTGRGQDGEKTYRSSETREIAFIPHDEVSSKKFLTSPEEILNSKAFIKAQALKGYIGSLLMTSGF
jgi:hypothetical protein